MNEEEERAGVRRRDLKPDYSYLKNNRLIRIPDRLTKSALETNPWLLPPSSSNAVICRPTTTSRQRQSLGWFSSGPPSRARDNETRITFAIKFCLFLSVTKLAMRRPSFETIFPSSQFIRRPRIRFWGSDGAYAPKKVNRSPFQLLFIVRQQRRVPFSSTFFAASYSISSFNPIRDGRRFIKAPLNGIWFLSSTATSFQLPVFNIDSSACVVLLSADLAAVAKSSLSLLSD